MRAFRRVVLVLLLVAAVVAFFRLRAEPSVATGSVLLFDLGGSYVDEPSLPLTARLLGEEKAPLAAVLSELRKAERDDRIASVVLRIRRLDVGWAKAQEIRDAVVALREAKRHPVAYLEIEAYGANLEYFVASAADEVWLSPATRMPFVGMAAEYLFLGGLWEKLGVQVDVERIGEYKSAAEIYAGKEMSEPHRVMADALLDSVYGQFVAEVAEGRGLTADEVRDAIDAAPVTPRDMQERKLVDGVAFVDEVIEKQGDRPLVKQRDYAAVEAESVGFAPVGTFALIYGTGPVVTGDRERAAPGGVQLASEVVSEALRDAADDPDVRAIIFRVDSPGGSPLASDVVWHAVREARAKGKPVVASLSDVAASGGYYVVCGADAIVADPATLTGSIGVFVLRPIVGGLLQKLDIGSASLTRGAHADLLLSIDPMKPETRSRLQTEVRSIYDLFVSRVAEGRNLDPARVDEVGRGRVWTGEQAQSVGLVDAIGGLRVAVSLAKEKVGLDPAADVVLVPFPAPKPLAVQISEALEGGAARAALPRAVLAQLPGSLRRLAEWVASVPAGAPALLPPFVVDIR